MASLRFRSGRYYVDYRVNGRRVRKAIGKSRKTAELALKDIEVKIERQEIGFIEKDVELSKLFQEYLALIMLLTEISKSFYKYLNEGELITAIKSLIADFTELVTESLVKPLEGTDIEISGMAQSIAKLKEDALKNIDDIMK